MSAAGLEGLARAVGIQVDWYDASGRAQHVPDDVLVPVLGALGWPAASERAVADSAGRLALEVEATTPAPLHTAIVDEQSRLALGRHAGLSGRRIPFEIELEHGQTLAGVATVNDAGELALPGVRVIGYHRLRFLDQELTLAVAPVRCFSCEDLFEPGERVFGLSAQIYSLRRSQPTGMGDFTALAQLAEEAAAQGGAALAINPVHAGFAAAPERYSPYAPSSRLFLNALYVDPAATFGPLAVNAVLGAEGAATLQTLDQRELIDWRLLAPLRLGVLRRLFNRRDLVLNTQLRTEFAQFRRDGGPALEDHARFEALDALYRKEGIFGWQHWPRGLRDPRSAAVDEVARELSEDIEFHAFLQWLAARGLRAAQTGARHAGMRIGLINDLAVGTDAGGSHAWSRQGEVLSSLSCGAPPDLYNPLGQSWGLTAFSPVALRRTGYRAFLETLRAALAYTGGVRIDHILGFARLWLVPDGVPPARGAYLTYPFEDLLRLTALESVRARALVIGENLGTVPAGFNERIEARGILGIDVLWFERDGGHPGAPFRAPPHWPRAAIATTTTHDLPTLAGWWSGNDIGWRERTGQLGGNTTAEAEGATRAHDRRALWEGLRAAGLVTEDTDRSASGPAPIEALLRWVARTPSPLAMVPLEDLAGSTEQPNLPGTIDAHPNWCRRLPEPTAVLLHRPEVEARLAGVRAERGQKR